MKRFRLALPLVSILLCVFSASCIKKNGTAQSGAAKNEIVFGEYGPLTGPESAFGVGGHRGTELAVEQINRAGGINGKPVRLVTYDDEGKSDVAVTVVTKLLTQDNALAILGEQTSTRSIAAGAVAQSYAVPMVSPSGTNPKLTQLGDYIFRVCFIDPFQGAVMAKFAAENLKLKTAAILRDVKSDYSTGLDDYFKKRFTALGGKIVADTTYSAGDLDFKSQLTAIKAAKPDLLYIPGYYTDAGLIARQARELNYKGELMGGDGWDGEQLFQIGGKSIAGAYFSNHYSNDDKSPTVQTFLREYKAKYNEAPASSGALAYDAAMLAADAARRAKELTPKGLRAALAETKNFNGVTGTITIDQNRNPVKSAVILKISPKGAFDYVTTITPSSTGNEAE